MSTPSEISNRVLVLTPTGRDGPMLAQRLGDAGFSCELCSGVGDLVDNLSRAGAVVVAQEALNQVAAEVLLEALEGQEPWSDVPVLLLTFDVGKRAPQPHAAVALFERANVMLLQRPLHLPFLLSALQSAVRARRRQYQMRDLHQDLERAIQLSDTFVSILSHDLRTPLGAIKMSAEIIMRASEDVRALRPAGRILTSADRMTRMIEQLLDLARVRQGHGIPVKPNPMNLEDLADQILQELRDAHPEARIIQSSSGSLAGTWDADRLGQVVSNLAGNAIKHGRRDEPISIGLDGSDPRVVRLSVQSFGAIPPEALPTLFEPFARSSSRAANRGLGLGLFIAREIARAHGGDLAVHSGDDLTIFVVTLPRIAVPPRPSARGR